MKNKPLVIILVAMLMALVSLPLWTSSAMGLDLEDARAKMNKAMEDTIAELGIEPARDVESYTPDGGGEYGDEFWRRVCVLSLSEYSSVSMDVYIYFTIEGALSYFESFFEEEISYGGYASRGSFHGCSAGSYYHIETNDRTGQIEDTNMLLWTYRNYVFLSWGDDCRGGGAQDKTSLVAEALFSNVQKQGLLGEPTPGKPPEPDNQSPVSSFSIIPPDPTPDDPVVCVSTSSDPDGDELLCTWYLDGDFADLDSPLELGKLEPGEHTITLHVNDGNDGTDEYSQMITVGEYQVYIPTLPPLPKGDDFIPSWKKREQLMQQEQAVSRQEKIQENEAAYGESTEEAFHEDEQPAQVTITLPEETEAEPAAPETEDTKRKKAYILISPKMSWLEEVFILGRAEKMYNFFRDEGYEVDYVFPDEARVKEILLDPATGAIASFSHGGEFKKGSQQVGATIQGLRDIDIRELLLNDLTKKYMKERDIPEWEAEKLAREEEMNCGLKYLYNWSCYSFGNDSSNWDTRLADRIVRPGGKYWGDVGRLWGWGWLDEYEKPE